MKTTYPPIHKGIAGIKYFTELPESFRVACIQDFYLVDELRVKYPYLLQNQSGQYEAYYTNPETWEDNLLSLLRLIELRRVFVQL